MQTIGCETIDGVPHVNGKPAIPDDKVPGLVDGKPLFSQWRCPECNAHLSAESNICLNACHLSEAGYRRFQSGILNSYWKTKADK
jgi:hypothetical protein